MGLSARMDKVRVQVADSARYQRAVSRLKHLLNDTGVEDMTHSYHMPPEVDTFSHSYKRHKYSHYTNETVPAEINGEPQPIVRSSRLDGGIKVSAGLLELLHRQEDLIVQLEKEKDFLKKELLSLTDNVKELGEENENLRRRLTDSLKEIIAHGESETGSVDVEIDLNMSRLKKECLDLQEQVAALDFTVGKLRGKEQEALDKLQQALKLAQDTHLYTTQVQSGSEAALDEMANQLASTKTEAQDLRTYLDDSEKKLDRQREDEEGQRISYDKRLKVAREDRDGEANKALRLQGQLSDNVAKFSELEEDLRSAQAGRLRLEKQLEEQRVLSTDGHSRIDHILKSRSDEALAAGARARELEVQLETARQDTSKLLQTITTMAQSGSGGTATTDDVKSAQAVAQQQQLSTALDALQSRHEAEVSRVQNVVAEQKVAMEDLASEIAQLKDQLADDSKSNREHWEEVERGLARFGSQDHLYKLKTNNEDNTDHQDEVFLNEEENPDEVSDDDTEILNIPFKGKDSKTSDIIEDKVKDTKSLIEEEGDEDNRESDLKEKAENDQDNKETEKNKDNSENDIVLLMVKKLSPDEEKDDGDDDIKQDGEYPVATNEEENDDEDNKQDVEHLGNKNKEENYDDGDDDNKQDAEQPEVTNEEENESLIPDDSTENNDEYIINQVDPDDSMGPVSNIEEDIDSTNEATDGSKTENTTNEENPIPYTFHKSEEDVDDAK